jgi:hypothetical protein
MNLFLVSRVLGLAQDPRLLQLDEAFHRVVRDAGLEDLLNHQLGYAIRVADAPGDLSYEEMHKLFSLADEIHALRELGFEADDSLVGRFEETLRRRFASQPRETRVAAQQNVEPWNQPLWWYAAALGAP